MIFVLNIECRRKKKKQFTQKMEVLENCFVSQKLWPKCIKGKKQRYQYLSIPI